MAHSSIKAKCHALVVTDTKLAWIQSFYFFFPPKIGIPLIQIPTIYCNNVGATSLSLNPILHSRMNRITKDVHYICDQVQQVQVHVAHISTHD